MSQASEYAQDVSRILQNKANAIAEGKRASGQILGQTVATLGQVIPQAVQQVMQRNAQKRRDAQLRGIFQRHGGNLGAAIDEIMSVDPVLGLELAERHGKSAKAAYELQTMEWESKRKRLDYLMGIMGSATDEDSYADALMTAKLAGLPLEGIPPAYDPAFVEQANRSMLTAKERLELDKPKAPEPFTLTPGAKRFDATGKLVAEVPYELTPDQQADNARMAQADERASRAEERMTAAQQEAARHNRAMEARAASGAADPLVAIVGPDGQPVLVPRSQAVGKKPAGGVGGANRKITSGDANRIADFDTSLDDVSVLERDLGATGAGSALGAALPNVVSEYTGIGSGSKSRQAVIDRVKQVIGKALEGGVLRKEDEEKYKKILPTIGDPPDVAKAKINGLRSALIQRRERLIESLDDAGYDTSGYAARQAAPQAAPQSLPSGNRATPQVGSMVTFNGKRYKVLAIKNGQAELELVP